MCHKVNNVMVLLTEYIKSLYFKNKILYFKNRYNVL